MSTPPIPPSSGSQPPAFEPIVIPLAPQPAATYPPAPSNMYAQPGYPPPVPSSSGNTVLKVVLIVVGIFVLFGAIAAAILGYGAYRLSKAVHHAGNGDVSFSTPNGGSFSTNNSSLSSADLGVPAYPDAQRSTGGMRMKSSAGSLITATFTTTDSADKVAAFYKQKMGEQATLMEIGSSTILTTGNSGEDKVVVTIAPENSHTKITILHTSHLHGQ